MWISPTWPRLRPAVLAAGLVLASGVVVGAQTPAVGTPKVALIYDDQKLADGERATLFGLVADLVPVSEWRTVSVSAPTDLRTIVDRYYDYFSSGPYAAPLTVNAAVRAIQQRNGISGGAVPGGASIRIPPLPMRAFGEYGYARELRIFSAESRGYATSQNGATVALPTRAEPLLPSRTNAAAQRLSRASSTAIILDVSSSDLDRLTPNALPTNVVALNALPVAGASAAAPKLALGMVQVELPAAQNAGCPDPIAALAASPFRQAQIARMTRVAGPNETRLLELAGRRPLVILDVGFATHHGQKVRAVANQVLHALGAPDSVRQKIVEVEMFPINSEAQQSLSSALDTYEASQPLLVESVEEFKQNLERARAWIATSMALMASGKLPAPRLDMPEVLIRALLFRHITSGAIVNMSFRMRAPATAALLNQFASDRLSFSVAGVGDVVGVIEPGWTPQDAILAQPNFVNVTYGTEDGAVLAEHGGDVGNPTKARVSLLAPGCGFNGISESGTSLASPYVAASSWLRSLLDEMEFNRPLVTQDFWRELLLASRPIPALQHPVESGGMFDPAMLIAPPPLRTLVRRDGEALPLAELRATGQCKTPDGPVPINLDGEASAVQEEIVTFAVHITDKRLFLWRRRIPLRDSSLATSRIVCELQDLAFHAVDLKGVTIDYGAGMLGKFATEIAFVTW